jgi:hypothetical protein
VSETKSSTSEGRFNTFLKYRGNILLIIIISPYAAYMRKAIEMYSSVLSRNNSVLVEKLESKRYIERLRGKQMVTNLRVLKIN